MNNKTDRWKIRNDGIYVDNGNGGWTRIAKVVLPALCKSLVLNANTAHEIEGLVDIMVFNDTRRTPPPSA
jgi:hypothetical protein